MRIAGRLVLLLLLLVLNCTGRAQTRDDDIAAWTLQLIHHPLDLYLSNVKLISEQPEQTYSIVHDHWGEILDARGKVNTTIAFRMAASPHLLELLDLAMRDENPSVRYNAADALYGFAFRTFDVNVDNLAYLQWHKTIERLPQDVVVRNEEREFFKRLDATKDPIERTQLLNVLLRADFTSSLPSASLRRQVARECKALEILGRFLSPPESATVLEIYTVGNLRPDQAYLRRVIAPLTDKTYGRPIRYAALTLLSSTQSPAASEVMTRMLMQGRDPDGAWILRQCLPFTSDRSMIPILIGVLEAEDDAAIDELLQPTLQRLTGTGGREQHDGGWWRLWWNRNHARFTSVADPHIPRFMPQLRAFSHAVAYRREIRWMEIDGNPRRAYWLICPGAIAGSTVGGTAQARRLGLIVVLGTPGSEDDLAMYWSNAGRAALNDDYYIAVPAAPDVYRKGAWLTENLRSQTRGAYAAESFTRAVVDDVCKVKSIDRQRCFLHGVGDAGMAAYVCALAPSSPFHGFYVLASGFKSAVLPSLSFAKNRKFYLQNSAKDATAPMWQVTAAAEMLKKNGATVKVVTVDGDHGYNFTGDPWKPITEAVKWLEEQRKD